MMQSGWDRCSCSGSSGIGRGLQVHMHMHRTKKRCPFAEPLKYLGSGGVPTRNDFMKAGMEVGLKVVVVGLKGRRWKVVSQRVDQESGQHARSNALKMGVIVEMESARLRID